MVSFIRFYGVLPKKTPYLSLRKTKKLNKVRKISPRKFLYTVPLEKNFIYYTHLFAYMSIRERKVTFLPVTYIFFVNLFLSPYILYILTGKTCLEDILKKIKSSSHSKLFFSQNKLLFYTRR